MIPYLLNPFLHLTVLLLVGLVVVFGNRARTAGKLGQVLAVERVDRRPRRLALAGVAAAAVLVVLARDGDLLRLALSILVPAALLLWLYPAEDRVCGDAGVAFGWDALRFEELEEWRLTGDHLRFRHAGEWRAVPVAAQAKDELRRRLTAVAPDRESPFRY